jgi:hypothetical protein
VVAYLIDALSYKPGGRGSIFNEVIGLFSWPNPTQPLTEMSTSSLPGGKGWQALKADKFMCEPRRLTTIYTSTVCYKNSFFYGPDMRHALCKHLSSSSWKTLQPLWALASFSVSWSIFLQSTGLLEWVISSSQGLYRNFGREMAVL